MERKTATPCDNCEYLVPARSRCDFCDKMFCSKCKSSYICSKCDRRCCINCESKYLKCAGTPMEIHCNNKICKKCSPYQNIFTCPKHHVSISTTIKVFLMSLLPI